MAILETISETISSTGREIADKTKEISEIGKLKAKIASEEKVIRHTYYEIGKKFFESAPADVSEDFAPLFKLADEATENIKTFRAEINELKGVIVCEECGNLMDKGNLFCGKCGAKLPIVEEDICDCEECECDDCAECTECEAAADEVTDEKAE